MNPYTDDDKRPGTFQYAVALPTASDFGYALAELRLTPVSPNNAQPSPVKIDLLLKRDETSGLSAGALELPVGRYVMDLELRSTRRINGIPLTVMRKETVYIYPNLTTSTSELGLDKITIAADFDAEVRLAGWIDPAFAYIPSNSTVQVQLRKNDNTVAKTVPASRQVETGRYRWDFGSIPSELIGGSGDADTAWVRYVVTYPGTVYTSNWLPVGLSTQGSDNIVLQGIPVALNVTAARTPTLLSPCQVTVSWDHVTYDANAEYIHIYRNDGREFEIPNNNWVSSYADNTASAGPYTYRVRVGDYYDNEGALSNVSNSVPVPPTGMPSSSSPVVAITGTISISGESDTYNYTVGESGYYSIQDARNADSAYVDIDATISVNSVYSGVIDDQVWSSNYLYAGDAVEVIVRVFSGGGNTGPYLLGFRKN